MHILMSIPWYVYLLFGYVIVKGITALHTRVVPIKKIVTIPLIFVGLGINSLLKSNLLESYLIWLGFFGMAAFAMWRRLEPMSIICDKQRKLLQIPGSWVTLAILLSIFASRFAFGFLGATHPEWKKNCFFYLSELSISGSACGISVGRVISLIMKYFKASHMDLQATE